MSSCLPSAAINAPNPLLQSTHSLRRTLTPLPFLQSPHKNPINLLVTDCIKTHQIVYLFYYMHTVDWDQNYYKHNDTRQIQNLSFDYNCSILGDICMPSSYYQDH